MAPNVQAQTALALAKPVVQVQAALGARPLTAPGMQKCVQSVSPVPRTTIRFVAPVVLHCHFS
jgi:hypothetical protein